MAVDATPLNTLTTQELNKLMEVAHQLHRKFGHPSNRLLIKNLRARNADSKVIAAVSLLKCDECLEGKIKLPTPAGRELTSCGRAFKWMVSQCAYLIRSTTSC